MSARVQRILIVESRYFPTISDAVLDGAIEAARAAGVEWDVVTLSTVQQLPLAIGIADDAARAGGAAYDGYVALACVLTDEVIGNAHMVQVAAHSLTDLSVQRGLALGIGVFEAPTETDGLRWAREADGGGCAVRYCLELMALKQRLAGA